MKENKKAYEPPRAKIYRFDDNEQILTSSGGPAGPSTDPTNPAANYAANALNQLLGGTNTTIE